MKSLNETCEEVDVAVITGDTKVMPQDKLDGIVMVTTGIGIAKKGEVVRDSGLQVGDKIIVTGSLGDHGMSLMSFREGFGFDTDLKSDVAPMWNIIKKALDVGGVTAMKDPTRGGFANAINEMASKSGNGIVLEQDAIPIREEVHAVSEMLGIDPFEVANEGKVVMGVKADKAEAVLEAIKGEKYGENAVCGIMTKGTQAAKGSIRNCARLLGSKMYNDTKTFLSLGDQIAKDVPIAVGISFKSKMQ